MTRQLLIIFLLLSGCDNTQEKINRIELIKYSSAEEQYKALTNYADLILKSDEKKRAEYENKFLASFPPTWTEYQLLFASDNMLTETHPIHILGELKYVDKEQLYNRVIDYSINGEWNADFERDFFLYEWFFKDMETMCRLFNQRGDSVVLKLFRFMYDGPHPQGMIDHYRALHCALNNQDKHLAKLLEQAYNQLLSEDDGHGH